MIPSTSSSSMSAFSVIVTTSLATLNPSNDVLQEEC